MDNLLDLFNIDESIDLTIMEEDFADAYTEDSLLEDAKYNKENKYPVFIVLMHTRTSVANLIKAVTKDTYSHACISFNPNLDPLYSFGRKKLELDFNDIGFVINDPKDEFFTKFKSIYSVYVMYVDKNTYKAMKNRLQYFIDNKSTLKYDIFSLVLNYLHIAHEPDGKYFCSRFVAEILNSGKALPKNPSLYRPEELQHLEDIELVNSGDDFYKYNPKETIKNLKKIKDRYKE